MKLKLKKNIKIYSAVCFICASFLISCATNAPVAEYVSGDQVSDDMMVAIEEPAPVVQSEPEPEKNKKDKKKDKKEKKEKKEAVEEPQVIDGWVIAKGKNVDVSFGIVRIKANPDYGSFNFSVINDDQKSIPVLSTSNEYISTSFYLKYGKKIYKLNENSAVKSGVGVNYEDKAVKISYNLDQVADVDVIFKAVKSSPTSDYDMIRVSADVRNTSSKKSDFALKLVLDTILGEIDRHHFYDNEGIPVRNEIGIRNIDGEKWFVSKNSNASMQILPYGADATVPAFVALGNLGTLQSGTWEPDMLSYRAFDTVLSYNNSAACIIWPEKRIGSAEKFTEVFYISLAAGDEKPHGAEFVYADKNKKDDSPEQTEVKGIPEPVGEKKQPVVFNEPKPNPAEAEKKTFDFHDEAQKARDDGLADASSVKFQNKEEEDEFKTPVPDVEVLKPKEIPSYEQSLYNPRSDVKFDVASPSKQQLSDEYVQNLLNRISALEEGGDAVNRSELLQLNAELDAILETLRQ